jgi:hypothetical protein
MHMFDCLRLDLYKRKGFEKLVWISLKKHLDFL